MQKTVDRVSHELDKQEGETEQKGSNKANDKTLEVQKNIQPVLVIPSEPTDVERFWGMVEPIFEPLATVGIVLILTIFMLIQREDLRNRFMRLVGQGRMTLTTRTMDEAGQRISRFLLAQSVINTGFGILVAAALFWIGVPYAILWGVTAALLRFVPYIGSLLAMLLPTALAFVLFDGWSRTLTTLGLFLSSGRRNRQCHRAPADRAPHGRLLSGLARLGPILDLALGAHWLGSVHPAHRLSSRNRKARAAVGISRRVAGG